jgi:hypothetical protein
LQPSVSSIQEKARLLPLVSSVKEKARLLQQPAVKRPLVPDPKVSSLPNKKTTLAPSGSALGGGTSTVTLTAAASSSSSHGGNRDNATNSKVAGDAAATGEVYEGLTLRVVPFDGDSSHDATKSSVLPTLYRPLLRVSAKSVSVAKVQRFIHKRMSADAPPEFPPEAIEILRNGVVQPPTSSISQTPKDGGGTNTNASQSASEGVILLTYRRLIL